MHRKQDNKAALMKLVVVGGNPVAITWELLLPSCFRILIPVALVATLVQVRSTSVVVMLVAVRFVGGSGGVSVAI